MIIFLDILIILFITTFGIYNSFNKSLISEVIKLISVFIAILLTNVTPFYNMLNQFLTSKIKESLEIHKLFNIEIFNAISFIITFISFYFIIHLIGNYLQNHFKDYNKNKSDFLHKMIIVFLSTIRITLFITLFTYGLESSIFHSELTKKRVHASPSLRAFSYFSKSIIND